MSYAAYSETRLVWSPDAETTAVEVRVDYLGWWSEQLVRDGKGRIVPEFKREAMSKQRGLVKSLGGVVKGTKEETRYIGIGIIGPMDDSGYRVSVPMRDSADGDPAAGLAALHALGIPSQHLDIAYAQLTDTPTSLCMACGRISIHTDGHLACRTDR